MICCHSLLTVRNLNSTRKSAFACMLPAGREKEEKTPGVVVSQGRLWTLVSAALGRLLAG